MMATFDDLIQEIDSRYCLGPKAYQLVQETFPLITGQTGGVDGLLDRFKAAGFAVEVASWSGGSDPVPLSGQEVEQTLGHDAIGEFANKIGMNPNFARTILGYAIPEIIVLAKGGAVPSAIPDSVSSVLESAIPLSPSPVEKLSRDGTEQIQASGRADFLVPPQRVPQRFKQLIAYGSYMALAACLFGFAWAGWYSSGGLSPRDAIRSPSARTAVLQESAERTETQMADDIRALKAGVEPLRAAQSQSQMNATALEGLKTRLDAVKSETAASLAEVVGKLEQMQREPEAKFSQLLERLDRIEHQIAGPLATAPLGVTSLQGAASARKQAQIAAALAKPPAEYTRGQSPIGGRGDAFDPSQNPAGPGSRRNMPQLITNWIVRDVYDGIALVESPRGSIEVTPGGTIPGAGTVISIEPRGTGWIVISSRGLVDSAPDRFQPIYQPRF
jgi:uncharacterized protein YidB (DUF937 family)